MSCSINQPLPVEMNNESISIEKPKLSYNFNKLPSKIKILFSDSNSDKEVKEFLEGLSVNYFYYKNLEYKPEINFINLENLKKINCSIKDESKTYLIMLFNNKLGQGLEAKCLSKLLKLKGVLVLFNNDQKVGNSNLTKFKIDRKEDYYNLLNYARKEGNKDSIIIDDKRTKDKDLLSQIWKVLNGNVVRYSTSEDKQNEKLLSNLLLIENSKSRTRKLSRILSVPLEVTPRRRLDIDSLILSVSISKARSLKPALEYNFGESLSVYLLSDWRNDEYYSNKEMDLEGITLIDMPWMLSNYSIINGNKEHKRSRDFAVGYDVYELIILLNNPMTRRNFTYKGMSGEISLSQGKLIRKSLKVVLEKGKYKNLGY